MNTGIEIRRSVRKYKKDKFDENMVANINNIIENLQPLYSEIEYDINLELDGDKFKQTFTGFVHGLTKIDSPHYIIINSSMKQGFWENCGYIGEQIVLELVKIGIGTCWIGSPIKDKVYREIYNPSGGMQYVIHLAVGYPDKELDVVTDRKREPLDHYFPFGCPDEYLSVAGAVINAPSANNYQPLRILCRGDEWEIYMKTPRRFKERFQTILGRLNRVDMGIALWHIKLAMAEIGKSVEFKKLDKAKKGKYGNYYISVILEA